MPHTRRFNDNEQYSESEHPTTRLSSNDDWDYEETTTGDPRYNAHGGRHPQQETSPGLPVRKGLLDKLFQWTDDKNKGK